MSTVKQVLVVVLFVTACYIVAYIREGQTLLSVLAHLIGAIGIAWLLITFIRKLH